MIKSDHLKVPEGGEGRVEGCRGGKVEGGGWRAEGGGRRAEGGEWRVKRVRERREQESN
jgi:hypothetical protein